MAVSEPAHSGNKLKGTEMKKSEVFPSKFIKADDLDGSAVVVKIAGASFEPIKSQDGKEQNKMVLAFHGTEKTLPLNQTNWDSVADICGDDSDGWVKKKIELYPATTQMNGKTVPCIRVRKPSPPAQPKLVVAAAAADDDDDDLNDAIPF
jgi:hypothetical protein